MSRLGFGTAALGRSVSRSERVRILETALDAGITHFDTAPLYGRGAAERALSRLPRDRITIATKAGIEPTGVLRGARGGRFAPAEVRASLEASLRRLRTSYVDLLLLHEVTAAAVTDELLELLAALVDDGLVRETGSATNAQETTALLARGTPFPSVVQVALADAVPGRRLILHSAIVGRAGDPAELVASALTAHPDAIVLFGSRNPEHVRATAAASLR